MPPGALPPVLFGKLPDRGDFVRHGGSPALDALDTVTQRALWPSLSSHEGPRFRFVYNPPGGPHLLAGALQLSRDRVGRVYPLIAGRAVDRRELDPAAAPAWPLWWGGVFDEATTIVRGAVDGHAPFADVLARVVALPDAPCPADAPPAARHATAAAAIPARDLFQRLPGGPEQALRVLHQLALTFRRTPRPGYGLSLPLPQPSAGVARSDGVAFWLAAGARLMTARPPWPTLFWTEDATGVPGTLVVFYGGLSSAALRPLLVGSPDPNTVLALDAGRPAAVPAAVARLLADPSASVADVLARLHTLV